MRKFKFFQKPVKGDLTMLDGQTFATGMCTPGIIGVTGSPGTTGSPGIGMYGTIDAENAIDIPPLHEWDTPQGYNYRRRLYHTNREEYERLRQEYLHQRLGNTNDDRERYFIENSFRGLTRDLNDNRVEPPVIKPKSKISKFTDWCLNNADMILYGVGVFFALSVIATFMIYFK
jgi:hypothetical protein